MKAKNTQKPQNGPEQELQRGIYTPNQCIFFTVIALAAMIPFLGQRMSHLTQEINNHSLKNIYAALSAPVASVTESAPTAAVIPILRNAFIHTAGLQNRSEWDTFFYRQDAYNRDVSAFYALSGESEQMGSINGFSDDLSSSGSLPKELLGAISQQTLRNVALPVVHSAQSPLRLFFFGDSQMHSIAAGMTRALGPDASIAIESLSVHSSGFLRSDYYNWPQKLETIFAAQKDKEHFDAAVIFLGMNDYQDMWTSGGIILTAGTPEWEEIYRKMVKAHLDIVLNSVPRLYWFGLPAVRRTDYNEKIQYLDTVHRSIAEEYDQKRLVKVSLKDFTREAGTGYIGALRLDDSSWIPFMQTDGIHYTIEGGEYLMKKFITQLHRDYRFTSQ